MRLFREVSRFGFVGVAATGVHVVMGLSLHKGLSLAPFWANLFAFCCALGVSFMGQTRLTFREATADGQSFLRFVTVALTGLALNQAVVWVVTSALGGPYWVALAVIVLTAPGITFALLQFWALRRLAPRQPPSGRSAPRRRCGPRSRRRGGASP